MPGAVCWCVTPRTVSGPVLGFLLSVWQRFAEQVKRPG